ncbi:MAG: hypothetical protein R2776_06450 [Flavobacteriaceae bacterium]
MSYILAFTFFSCLVLLGFFHKSNRHYIMESQNIQQDLKKELAIQKTQIMTRKLHLDKYHFLKYNLDESLVIQPEINI